MARQQITISQLKTHLSSILAKVRKGASVTVLDRKEPIALLSSISSPSLKVVYMPKDKFELPAIKGTSCFVDPLDILLEDRKKR